MFSKHIWVSWYKSYWLCIATIDVTFGFVIIFIYANALTLMLTNDNMICYDIKLNLSTSWIQ